jgi:eukaryotic-like serine/threonine-protein kinase
MQLENGATLAHYEIVQPLGKGGMGEVYRARDTRLGREVAIKVLPEEFTSDPEWLGRFEREARMLAALDHPRIAAIHGIENDDGLRFLVMQLVEGQNLAERLRGAPFRPEEAIGIARQTAEALEVAHEKGIVHRDLKPANVMVDDEGNVKVLDFGLARAFDTEEGNEDFANSPTMVRAATHAGVILGTAAYMSPEQARGKKVDKRADIWAFGVVLWEMLTGERLFEGETVSDTLAAVLTKSPDFSRLPAETPSPVRRILERSLERNPRQRLRDIGEARIALEGASSGEAASEVSQPVTSPKREIRTAVLALLAGLVLGVIATMIVMMRAEEVAAPSPPVRFRIDTGASPGSMAFAISPDGRSVAWSAGNEIWIRRLDQLEPRSIRLPWPGGVASWTPDGRSVVTRREAGNNRELWKVSLDGGSPVLIGSLPADGFVWGIRPGADDEILIGMADAGIYSLPVRGGAPKQIVAPEENESLGAPFRVSDRVLLFANITKTRIEAEIDGERKIVLERPGDRIFDPLLSPTGHLLFRADGGRSARGIWAVPFSIDRLEPSGEPFQLLPYGTASISSDGTIAFLDFRSNAVPSQLVEIDRAGELIAEIGDPLPGLRTPSLSPNGMLVAASALGSDGWGEIVVFNRRTGAYYSLPDSLGSDWNPFWREGGKTIGFLTWGAGIRQARERSADGRGEVRLLDVRTVAAAESPDGRYLVTSFYETYYREHASEEKTVLFDDFVSALDFSPDGRWIAYVPVSGTGLYLRRFPEGDLLTPVTSGDAGNPRFSANGRELYFWDGDAIMVVDVALEDGRASIGKPQVLFAVSPGTYDTGRGSYDVTSEGHFLMARRAGDRAAADAEENSGIVILQNWASDLAR